MDESTILTISAAATAVMTLLAFWHGLIARDPVSSRLRGMAKLQTEMRAGVHVVRGNTTRTDFRRSTLTFMRNSVEKLNLSRGRQIERTRARLARAGWRSGDALTAYIFVKAVLPVAAVVGTVFLMGLRGQSPLSQTGILFLAGAGAIGFFGPDLLVKNTGDNRVKKLTLSLPDALDLLVICAEAGLSLDAAIKRVGREMAFAAPEMADELMLTAIELSFLPDRQTALQNLISRTDVPKLRALVNSLIQSERYGTPLANSLRVLSAEFRDERLMAAEEKAAKLPAIMTVPMILFILPALFMIIMGPAVLHVMDAFK
jgi:tight adherence protein C